MGFIKTKAPKPNMNREYVIDITPCTNGKITIYDISRHFPPYNCRTRTNMFARVTHVISGKTADVYVIDDYKILNRKQAINLSARFINGDFDTYRLD